jgi:hypothetical protein
MDQVVDRFIAREHALMNAMSVRTPVVETYLQDLTLSSAPCPRRIITS